jgi:hypothetical protein
MVCLLLIVTCSVTTAWKQVILTVIAQEFENLNSQSIDTALWLEWGATLTGNLLLTGTARLVD